MKALLDECVDWRLGRDIIGHEVRTARQMGWTAVKNGDLLSLASDHFDVFVTVDQNLVFQQKLAAIPIGIVVLRAPTNRLADLRIMAPELLAAIDSTLPGQATFVGTKGFLNRAIGHDAETP